MVQPRYAGSISIVGQGGMGSRVSEGLVRSGCGTETSPLTLYDADQFDRKNRRNQWCGLRHIRFSKVMAVAEQLLEIDDNVLVETHVEHVTRATVLDTEIVFLCLDKMADRGEIIEHCLGPNVRCVIETRMDSNRGVSHCFDPRNAMHRECWWLYWFPDTEAENIGGCNGDSPVISAIYGTTCIALKQFEAFLENDRSALGLKANRVYSDFVTNEIMTESWPT